MATMTQQNRYAGGSLRQEIFSHSKWLKFIGFALLLIGVTTIVVPLLPEFHSAAVIAGMLAASGVIYISHAIVFWRQKWLGFAMHMLLGVLYISIGNVIYIYPLLDVLYLASSIIAAYLIIGAFRIRSAMSHGEENSGWSWTLLCGVVNIILAGFIISQITTINFSLISLVIGVELAFAGIAMMMLGVNAQVDR